jgi:ATP-dependent Lhr-like helicase
MSAFDKLAPFIREYIYKHNWQELREAQETACDIIFNTDDNMLISTPTASGKTEAAFLPVITDIYNNPPSSVGVLYVAPLKALINDQFVRVEKLLQKAEIRVTKWHGDASLTEKKKLLKSPSGVLQITPESLEAMLMRRKQDVVKLFSDLRYIIIDEIHNFIGSDRGTQLSSILERIQALAGIMPRRIGLSATLGDIKIAEEWLNCGTERKCNTPNVNAKRNDAAITLEHFYTDSEDLDDESWVPYFQFLYVLTQGRKSIVFSNSRSETETNINRLKLLAESKNEHGLYHVHHGNISSESREYIEEKMRTSKLPLVVGATVTLELGIDLGGLELIVQTGSPHSVSSLAQRLGRSGRRNGKSEMCFVFSEDSPSIQAGFYQSLNWLFVKCIALIELYRENWVEPLRENRFPYNILFHQTMSVLYGNGDTAPNQLAGKILRERTFANINQGDYQVLLKHLIELDILEKAEGKLAIGKKGERLANSFEFYSVFETQTEYSVRDKEKEIGTLNAPLPKGERFLLGGEVWQVEDIDNKQRIIYVKPVGGKSDVSWENLSFGEIHTKVLQKMRDVIVSEGELDYLSESAARRLKEIRTIISRTEVFTSTHQTDIIEIAPGRYGVFPWLGTRALNALKYSFQALGIEVIQTDLDWILLTVRIDDRDALNEVLKQIKTTVPQAENLPLPATIPPIGKYGQLIPQPLVRKQFIDRYIDVDEMRRELSV